MLLTNEEDVGDGAHHCAIHYMLLTNEEEVDDGAHHCVEDDGPEVAHEDPVVEGPGRL